MAPKLDQFYARKVGGYFDEHDEDADDAFGLEKMSLGGLGGLGGLSSSGGLGGLSGSGGLSGLGGLGKGLGSKSNISAKSKTGTGLFASTSKGFGAPKTDDSSLAQIISSNNAQLVESINNVAKKNEAAMQKIAEYLERLSETTLSGFMKLLEEDKSDEGAHKSLELIMQQIDEGVSETKGKVFIIMPGYETDPEEEVDINELIKDKEVHYCASVSDVVKLVGQEAPF
jgi:hypothetical protein